MAIKQQFTQNSSSNGNAIPTLNIDPTAPITSLSKGTQQFTIVRDTNHGDSSVINAASKEINGSAEAGNKHVIIEYGMSSRADLEKEHPLFKNMSTKDALINIKHDISEFEKLGLSTSDLFDIEFKLRVLDVVERANSRPPQITADEIINNSDLFESSSAKTDAERIDTGLAYTNLIIESMQTDTTIHLAGDYPGEDNYALYSDYGSQMQENDVAKNGYIQNHQELNDAFEKYSTS